MPRLVQVMTLKNISLDFVLKNLKNYSTEELHSLPGQLNQDLIDALKLGEQHYNIPNVYKDRLICPTLTKLGLDLWKSLEKKLHDINDTAKLITCKNLTHLNMDWVVDAVNVNNLIGNIPKIVDLRFRRCNDDILEEIGNSCPDLKILFLNDAKVSDEGISRLCQSKTKGWKIERLNIEAHWDWEEFTKKGCLTALENLKSLRYFEDGNQLFDLFCDWRESSSNFPTLQLTELSFWNDDILEKKDFFLIRKVCPQLRKLCIYCSSPADDLYLVKTPWDQLEHFELEVGKRDFFSKCLPILTNIGANFTTLVLEGPRNIQVIPLSVICPNLINLQLLYITFSSEIGNYTSKDCEIPFRKLKSLRYFNSRDYWDGVDEEIVYAESLQIKLLMQNCFDLKKLELLGLRMKEETFLSILQVNPLIHLTKFKIFSCETLTTAVVMELLQKKNELEFLNIMRCPQIDPQTLRSYIKRYNYNVKYNVKWF